MLQDSRSWRHHLSCRGLQQRRDTDHGNTTTSLRGCSTEVGSTHSWCLSCPHHASHASRSWPPPKPSWGRHRGRPQCPRSQRCHAGCPAVRGMQLRGQGAGLGMCRAACLALTWVSQEPPLTCQPVLVPFCPVQWPWLQLWDVLPPPMHLCSRKRLAVCPGCGQAPQADLAEVGRHN